MTFGKLIHYALSSNFIGWEVGKYAGIALVFCYFKFMKHVRPHLPHRHTGYVSMNGAVWNCPVCGKPPKNLEQQLAEVKAEIAERPWMGPYMGPKADRAQH
jgi:hypothetical protein